MVSWQAFPSLPPRAHLSISLTPKTPLPFPFKCLPHRLTKTRPFLLQIAASHTSKRYNTHHSSSLNSKLFLQVLSMLLGLGEEG